MAKFSQELFDSKAAQYVLGGMMHTPELVYGNDKYILTVDDFSNKVYGIIFGAVYNLAFAGAKKITPIEIDSYLSGFGTQYQLYRDGSGPELTGLIYEITEGYDVAQFEFFYNRVKKFTVLRDLRLNGFSIDEFYSSDLLNAERVENEFNKLTIKDILTKVRNKVQNIENNNVGKSDDSGQSAATGVRELLASLAVSPETGLPMMGEMVNFTTRGMRKGKMYLYSSNSGGGKSRTLVGNACSIAYPRIEKGMIVSPEELHPVLFIATEMRADEIQTLILANISGVNEEKILLNTLSKEEKRLINIAANIMIKYENNFIIEAVSDPTLQKLKSMISSYILQEDIEYIFYDYIFSSPGLLTEFTGIPLREDVILMLLSNTLKEIAADYNIFMMTSTQLNGTWEGKGPRNANMIRGSKAVVDKVDIGMIGVRLETEEYEMVAEYCKKLNLLQPNLVIDVYKNRRGRMCDIKIFRYFDYGTCRATDLLVTTANYKILDNPPVLDYPTTKKELSEYEQD